MKILIIEDEARIARRLARMTQKYFEQNLELTIFDALEKGLDHIEVHPVDILLLDLNLNGENGFEVLKAMAAAPFYTIIVSAYTDKAIEAFAYGVIDFVPKPFDEARLFLAFERATSNVNQLERKLQYLAVKKAGSIRLIDLKEVCYIKGAGIYSELHLHNGKQELHDKTLEMLEKLLPDNFSRIHKSYLVPMALVEKIIVQPGTRYSVLLKNGETLPIGRSKYKEFKDRLI